MQYHVWKTLCFFLLFLHTSCTERLYKSFLRQTTRLDSEHPVPASPCNQFLNYAPDESHPEHTPVRWVRVNFHIINNADSTSNFNLEDGIAYARGLIDAANWKLRNNQQMTLPEGNSTPVLPIKYQYVITPDTDDPYDPGVYVHYNESLAYFNKKGTSSIMNADIFNKYGSRKGEVLNIILIGHPPDSIQSPTYKSSVDGVGMKDWLKIVGCFQYHYFTQYHEDGGFTKSGPNYQAGALNHESGHTFGLAHTWNANDGCDDTPLNPGCWDQNSAPCKESGIYSNNMMDYNNCQCALSPCQIAKVHYNFSRENSSQRKLLLPVWCHYKKDSTITIGFGEKVEWLCSKDLEGDLIIGNDAVLTIHCDVSLPKGAKVMVKPKGTLILNGGKITNKCGDQWEGIEVWKSKKSEGKVIVKGNSAIEHARQAVEVIQHD